MYEVEEKSILTTSNLIKYTDIKLPFIFDKYYMTSILMLLDKYFFKHYLRITHKTDVPL